MEKEVEKVHHTEKKSSQSAVIAVMAVVIVVLLAVGGYFYYKSTKKQQMGQYAMSGSGGMMRQGGKRMGKGGGMMDMKPQPTPAMTAQQTKELADGVLTSTTEKTFDVNGGNFYFVPNKITVNKGDKVTIIFHNDAGFHNFIIDELNVKIGPTSGGKTVTASFTADKAGTFQYYCSIGKHRQMGMWGTLEVK